MIRFDETVYSLPMYEGGLAMTGPECSYWCNVWRACAGNKATIRAELALHGAEMDSAHLCFNDEQRMTAFLLRWM